MNARNRSLPRFCKRRAAASLGALVLFLLIGSDAAHAQRAGSTKVGARSAALRQRALDTYPGAEAAAREWAPDAALVYAESADSLASDGSARAWSFVFWSAEARTSRGFTVRGGGRLDAFDLPFAFDPAPIEAGWQDMTAVLVQADRDPAVAPIRAAGRPVVAVLSRGLVIGKGEVRSSWLITYPVLGSAPGQEMVFDALRGTLLVRRAYTAPPDGARSTASGEIPAYLSAHRTRLLARLEAQRGELARANNTRGRWLSAREAEASARLAAQDAVRDTLGRGEITARGAEVEKQLSGLLAWRARMAETDSVLERAASRIAAAERDLAAERPTELLLFVSGEERARPSRVSVFFDGGEIARQSFGEAEWKAFDAGAWAEVARTSVRSGSREVRVEVETPDRRVSSASWRGTLVDGRLSLLRVRLRGTGSKSEGPTFEVIAAGQP